MEKPKTILEYQEWHHSTTGEELSTAAAQAYELNLRSLKQTVVSHPFVSLFADDTKDHVQRGFYSRPHELTFITKPFDSCVTKLFRRNCHWNQKWPEPPDGEWITIERSYFRIDDLVRTTIVCTYLDGPKALSQRITELAQACGLKCDYSPRATDQGYYAWHVTLFVPTEVMISSGLKSGALQVEIQVTTVLQSVLKNLTHRFYEENRISKKVSPAVARWDFQRDEFKGSYLGHTLHLIEALLVELKDKASRNTPRDGEHNGQQA